MCWFSIIVGVVFLIYAWFRQVFLSVWHLTTDCLSSVSSSAYWEVATESWSDIFYLILSMILLIATDINTIFLLFGVLLHIVWNGCWHRIQIGFCTCHAVKIDSIMGIPEKLDPGPKTPWRTRILWRPRTLWEPRILGGTKSLGGTRILGVPGTPRGLKILWWSRKDPGIYKLGNVSLIPISFH